MFGVWVVSLSGLIMLGVTGIYGEDKGCWLLVVVGKVKC